VRMRHREAEHHDEHPAEREAPELANHGSIIYPAYRAGNQIPGKWTVVVRQAKPKYENPASRPLSRKDAQ
jgi:hypothetical protein